MSAPRRILFATDFSRASAVAFRAASRLAKSLGAKMTVLHVVPPVYSVEASDAAAVRREAEQAATTHLARLRPAAVRSLVGYGVVHEVIAREAERIGADLIIVGSHGRTGLRRALLGSVAAAVLRHAGCPVLTIPSGAR